MVTGILSEQGDHSRKDPTGKGSVDIQGGFPPGTEAPGGQAFCLSSLHVSPTYLNRAALAAQQTPAQWVHQVNSTEVCVLTARARLMWEKASCQFMLWPMSPGHLVI